MSFGVGRVAMSDKFKLLTECEAAERLGCSVTQITYMRETGKLSFIPGRPPLIDERDLIAEISAFPLLTEAQAADRLGCTPLEVQRLRERGRIGYVRLKPVHYREEDIQAFQDAEKAVLAREKANRVAAREWEASRVRAKGEAAERARIPVLRQARNGFYYIHWIEVRRTKRISTRTREEAEAKSFLAWWKSRRSDS
jgi:hypothetical protein